MFRSQFGSRVALASLAVVGVLVAVAGCATPGEKKTEVTFWHLQVGAHEAALQNAVAAFEAANPSIDITLEFQGDSATIHQKVLAAIEAGNPPTMAETLEPAKVGEYLEAGALTPVEDLFDGTENLDDVYPAYLANGTVSQDGKDVVVGWPFAASGSVMWYNSAELDANQVDVPSTWTDLVDAATTLTANRGVPAFAGNPSANIGEIYSGILGNGGELANADFTEAAFNDEGGVTTLSTYVDMVKAGTMSLHESFDWQGDFAAQRSVMIVGSSPSAPFLLDGIGGAFELGWAPFPAGTEKQGSVAYGTTVSIFSDASDAEQAAAWKFLSFFSTAPVATQWSSDSAFGFWPIRPSVVESAEFQTAASEVPGRLEAIQSALAAAQARPNIAAWNQVEAYLAEAIQVALQGAKSPQAALDEAVSQSNTALAP